MEEDRETRPDEDVEGQMLKRGEDEGDDVEGQMLKRGEDEDDDVEGQMLKRGEDEDDVEGHVLKSAVNKDMYQA